MGERVAELHHLLAGSAGVPRESRRHAGAGRPGVELSFPREGASEPVREDRQLQGYLLSATADERGTCPVASILSSSSPGHARQLQRDNARGLSANNGGLSLLSTDRSRFCQLLQQLRLPARSRE